jgi:hypothetical protein
LFVRHLPTSNPFATLAGSIAADELPIVARLTQTRVKDTNPPFATQWSTWLALNDFVARKKIREWPGRA